ncbi:MAG: DmsE family decaheme c-type cytochrome [Proteobacteria bacterium]|nr:DmsE family decaheme c-type cytochrome [Pseudomonadota bacterium]
MLHTIKAVILLLLLIPAPLMASSEYLGDKQCYSCHKEIKKSYLGDIHGKIFTKNPRNTLEKRGCEACHGPGGDHKGAVDKEEQGIPMMIEGFKDTDASKDKNKMCLACHKKGKRMHWRGSSHQMADLSCDNCHNFHEKGGAVDYKACLNCHPSIRGKIMRSSHMPLREGKMACNDCHTAHGELQKASVNETCYSCHAEKRGPFLWEHAPVREDCTTCHDPHGSNNPGMLTSKGAFLCLRCHQYGGHVNLPRYNRQSATVGQGCINCHSRIHGSNHPSGAKLTR